MPPLTKTVDSLDAVDEKYRDLYTDVSTPLLSGT